MKSTFKSYGSIICRAHTVRILKNIIERRNHDLLEANFHFFVWKPKAFFKEKCNIKNINFFFFKEVETLKI